MLIFKVLYSEGEVCSDRGVSAVLSSYYIYFFVLPLQSMFKARIL